jgi:hypothetical protein
MLYFDHFVCLFFLVGTGLRPKDEPLFRAMGGIPYSDFTADMAYRSRVCILGNGNSGFETAQNSFATGKRISSISDLSWIFIYFVADRVVIYGRHAPRLSAITRYTGDVRVKLIQVMENLNAKVNLI